MEQCDPRHGRHLGRFFLASDLDGHPEPTADDQRHLTRVLRARPGDRLEAIDGRGGRRALEVRAVGRRDVELEPLGPTRREPAPGAPGSPLPAIELACAPPRPNRIEPMLERLAQLGVARVRLLACAHTGPEDRRPKGARLARVLRESLKQSGAGWLPELDGPLPLEEFRPGAEWTLICDPAGERGLWDALAAERPRLAARSEPGTDARPAPALSLLVGPEGGFAPDERARLVGLGAEPVRLGPTILRIETAAELAVGAALLAAGADPGGS